MRFISRTGTAVVVILLAAAFGAPTFAQGLGEITVDSALKQPLRAHIELLDVGKLDASQIRVALASEAEFALAHVERNSNLAQLTFKVEVERNGAGRIVVTSQSEISEPVLNFLVGVSWPNGRTLREYTVLLDLQKNNKAAAVSPAVASSSTRASTAASAPQGYEVRKGETLYQIAEQTRPSQSVGVQQMMLALQRANEDAFVNNNVNRILTGKVLRIPRQDEIALIDQDAAVAQINQQNLEAQPLAVNDSTGAKSAPPRDELTLLSGAEAAVGGSSDLDKTIKQLENQLMLSEESLDRSKLENLELTNRLSAVQEQIDLLQNIITIEDERIAQLQKQLTSQSVATKDALNSAESAAKTASEGDTGEGILGLLTNSVVWLGGLLAVAIGVALMLFIKRRNARAGMTDDEEASLDELADAADADAEKQGGGGIGGMIAALLSRFRRKQEEEQEEPVFAEEEAAPVAAVAAKPAAVTQPSSTNTLLDEMGLTDLQNALDEAEQPVTSHPNATVVAPAPAVLPEPDTAVAEAGAVMEEAALLQQALTEAEQDVEEEDFLGATPEPAAPVAEKPAVPETFAFTAEAVAAPEAEAVELDPEEEKPEVFEFTLPSLEDIEAVESKTAEPPAAKDKDKVETISFNPSDVQAFDEDTIEIDDDLGDEVGDLTQDTHDARLDLAVAYEAMGDIDGAVEILEEVIGNGKAAQVAEAQRLKQKWQNG
jgi:FimV-like protein